MDLITNDRVIDERMLTQVERILRSDSLRNSELLRQLLKFLAQKSASGEAESLKEYTIAVDALSKPSTYDPRHDASVRIQVGRLRQKLAEYYRTQGANDTTIVDIPKGKFCLTCDTRFPLQVEASSPVAPLNSGMVPVSAAPRRRLFAFVAGAALALALLATLGWWEYSFRKTQAASPASAAWTSDLEQLWRPFTSSGRPLMLAVEDPLFVEFQRASGSDIYYRDRGSNDWPGLVDTIGVKDLHKSLQASNVQPSHYYTAFGEVTSSLMLGQLFGARNLNLSLVRTSELTWQNVADNNVVFVGMQVFFDPQLQGMPVHPQLIPGPQGVQSLQPAHGEPAMFLDKYTTAPTEEGEVYAVVTLLPGPVGAGTIASFTSNRAGGYVGAVQWFTDPRFASIVVSKLKQTSGEMPRYYQVLLKVRFKDQVPTETSYILSRILQ